MLERRIRERDHLGGVGKTREAHERQKRDAGDQAHGARV